MGVIRDCAGADKASHAVFYGYIDPEEGLMLELLCAGKQAPKYFYFRDTYQGPRVSIHASELEDIEITEELVNNWLIRNSYDDQNKLKYALGYFAKTDIQKAMMIAKEILRSDSSSFYLKETAMSFIVRHKSDESEQLVIDYIIDHEPGDTVYKIADGYWNG